MLIPQQAQSGSRRRQGSRRPNLDELRRSLVEPSMLKDVHRQRLLELAQRLARVQALGDEYGRVDFSDEASAAIGVRTAAV